MSDENIPNQGPVDPKKTTVEDLWPKKMHRSVLKAPVAILREQASILGERTQNVVTASVSNLRDPQSTKLFFGFNLVAPALNNYSLSLFCISYEPTQIYPVEITSDIIVPQGFASGRWTAEDEEAFKLHLKGMFADKKTITAIQSLMAQSETGSFGFPKDDDLPF